MKWPAGGGAAIRLDGQNRLDLTSIARDCSAGGLVVGDGYGSALGLRGFVWSASRGFNLLPNPPGTTILQVRDVNDAGQVVVYGADARIWSHDLTNGAWSDAGARLLPFPRADLASANQINAAGQIAGAGIDMATGVSQSAWLLSPAPAGLGLGEPFPGVAGASNALGAAGAAPGAALYLLAGFNAGATAVPGCAGLTVAIVAPRLLAAATADAQGFAQWTGVTPPAALAGRRLLVQAVELSGCRVSNLSSVDFQ